MPTNSEHPIFHSYASGKRWKCAECGVMNDEGKHKGFCGSCYAERPKGSAGKATKANDKLRAGDKVLGGYEMDADLKPVRRYVK